MKRITVILVLIVALLMAWCVAFAEETVEQELDREMVEAQEAVQPQAVTPAQTPGTTYFDGVQSGKNDAEGELLYGCGGFACGIFGVLAALVIKPEVDPVMMGGLISTYGNDYAQGYQSGYVREARRKNINYSLVGMALGIAVSVVYSLTAEPIDIYDDSPTVKLGFAVPFGGSNPSFSPGR